MKEKCDKCDRPAKIHTVEIVKGQKIEKNLCDLHAEQDPSVSKMVPVAHAPINELLSKFIMQQSGLQSAQDLVCEECGMTFSQFREHSLLGCPSCYTAFESLLAPLLERSHEGGTHHLGKVPARSGIAEQRQANLLRMRKQLAEAVVAENFELAARLRDDIRRYEESRS